MMCGCCVIPIPNRQLYICMWKRKARLKLRIHIPFWIIWLELLVLKLFLFLLSHLPLTPFAFLIFLLSLVASWVAEMKIASTRFTLLYLIDDSCCSLTCQLAQSMLTNSAFIIRKRLSWFHLMMEIKHSWSLLFPFSIYPYWHCCINLCVLKTHCDITI